MQVSKYDTAKYTPPFGLQIILKVPYKAEGGANETL